MNNYGYNPKDYIPDSSHWERMFGTAAQTILQIPQVVEAQKSLEDGRTNNSEIYEGLKSEIGGMKDEDVRTYFGMDKNTLLKIAKPGRNEGLEYFPRFAKITGEGLKSVYAMKNLNTSLGEIEGQNKSAAANQDFQNSIEGQMGIGGVAGVFGSAQPQGNMTPIGNGPSNRIDRGATPEDIHAIARRNNTPIEKLQPEMDIAKAGRVAGQVGSLDLTKTQGANIQNVAGRQEPIDDTTWKAIGTLPNENQEAQNIIGAKNAESQGKKADADLKKAEADLIGENNKKNKEDASTKQQEIENYTKLKIAAMNSRDDAQNRYNQLEKNYVMADPKEKDRIAREMKKLASDVERYNREEEQNNQKINKLTGLKLKEEGVSDAAIKDAEEFSKKYYPSGYAPGGSTDATARALIDYARNIGQQAGAQINLNQNELKAALDSGEQIAKIIYLIRRKAGLDQ